MPSFGEDAWPPLALPELAPLHPSVADATARVLDAASESRTETSGAIAALESDTIASSQMPFEGELTTNEAPTYAKKTFGSRQFARRLTRSRQPLAPSRAYYSTATRWGGGRKGKNERKKMEIRGGR